MERHHYTVILVREEGGGYHAFCPALKGCHTQGDTLEEALANVREAIEAYLESLLKHGEAVPIEDIPMKIACPNLTPSVPLSARGEGEERRRGGHPHTPIRGRGPLNPTDVRGVAFSYFVASPASGTWKILIKPLAVAL